MHNTQRLPYHSAPWHNSKHIEAIEKRLWNAADTLRANSNYASNEYFMPVMGLIFLRHAYSRYLAVKDGIEASLPKRGGKARPLTKEDFSQKGAIFLRPEAQFDYLVSLPDSTKRDRAIQHAMDTIEEDYDGLRGVLPRGEYSDLDNEVLGQLLRTLNPEELKQASGDIFGRIYEYFLTQFAAAIRAGRILLAEISSKVAQGESFAFESTLAGRGYARSIPRWRDAGYNVKIMFLSLPNVELAIARIAARAAQGGHRVAETDIRRRFNVGLENFHRIYQPLVDAWLLYDNSGPQPVLLDGAENK